MFMQLYGFHNGHTTSDVLVCTDILLSLVERASEPAQTMETLQLLHGGREAVHVEEKELLMPTHESEPIRILRLYASC